MAAQSSSPVPELPDRARALWYGFSANPIMSLLGKGVGIFNVATLPEEIICLARARYHGKWTNPKCVPALSEDPRRLPDVGPDMKDIFLGSVSKAELTDILGLAMNMSSVAIIVVLVNGDVPDFPVGCSEDWSCIRREVHWAQWTQFDASSQLWLLARRKGDSKDLQQLFDRVMNETQDQNHVVPCLRFPFGPYAGMAVVDDDSIPHARRGPQISFCVQAAKKQRTTCQVPVPRVSERVLTTGPWAGVREMAPQDFLHLYGYKDGVCNISLMTPVMQKKFLVRSVPMKVGELMWRLAVHALKSFF